MFIQVSSWGEERPRYTLRCDACGDPHPRPEGVDHDRAVLWAEAVRYGWSSPARTPDLHYCGLCSGTL